MTQTMEAPAAADTAIQTWHLDEAAVPSAIAKLQKLNDRAVRQGLKGRYSYRLGEVTRTPRWHDELYRTPGSEPDYYEVGVDFIVMGEPLKLNGWTFVATLTWEGDVLVTRTHPAFEGRIDESSLVLNWCDHCRTDRVRNDTYLLQHEDGTRKQVGSTCIKDFLGHHFMPSMASDGRLQVIEADCCAVRGTVDADIVSVLAWAASLTGAQGWISRDKAEIERRNPSSGILRDLLFGNSPEIRRAREALRPTEEHVALAAKVRDWACAVDDSTSEYLANVKRLATSTHVGPRNVGIIGSALASYHRELNLIAEREARPVSTWIGEPKQRLELALTVRSDTPIEGDYGVTHLYSLADAAGNVFKWFSSRNQTWEIGQDVRIKGTVKGHETYHDVKQTQLTRCAEIAQPEPELEAG